MKRKHGILILSIIALISFCLLFFVVEDHTWPVAACGITTLVCSLSAAFWATLPKNIGKK